METIFKKEDFHLCYLPVPKKYPYSQTHAGVSFSEKGIGGYHWFVVSSPYPNPRRTIIERGIRYFARKALGISIKPSDWYENPMLYYSNNWYEPPRQLEAFSKNPLMRTPKDEYGLGAFNSDPDVYTEGERIYILNRPVCRKKNEDGVITYLTSLYLMKIEYDGSSFIMNTPLKLLDYGRANASPSLVYYCGKYRLFSLITNAYNTGEDCECLEMRTCDSIDGDYSSICRINIETVDYQPWHMSVFDYKGKLYSVLACIKGGTKQRCYQMLGEFSEDLTSLHVFQTPLTDMKSYRGDATVLPNGKFVLYTAIIEPFPGSKSVDGRDIVEAEDSFESVLSRVKEYEKNIAVYFTR